MSEHEGVSTPTPTPQVPEKADVAVVFIHGIGEQSRGQTLLTWVEPLLQVMDECGPRYGLTTSVATASGLGGDMPEVHFKVEREGGGSVTWLLTEARWTEAFHRSSAMEVLRWAVRFSARAARRAYRGLSLQLRFNIRKVTSTPEPDPPAQTSIWDISILEVWLMGFLQAIELWFLVVPRLLALAFLIVVFPVLVVLALVGLTGLVVAQRIPGIGPRVTPVVAGLVTSVGDAQAYRDRRIQAAAMQQVIVDRMAEVSLRARSLVVVAHSQGAALACRALLGQSVPWPGILVTVGAGSRLLNDTQAVLPWVSLGCPPWVNIWTPLDVVPAGPIGDSQEAVDERFEETLWQGTTGGGFTATSADGTKTLTWVPGLGPEGWSGSEELVERARGHAVLAAREASEGSNSELQQVAAVPLRHEEACRIIYELLLPDRPDSPDGDGVPRSSGIGDSLDRLAISFRNLPAARDFDRPGPGEWPVANRGSLVRDHTSYSTNLTQVQYPLARILLNESDATLHCLPALSTTADHLHTGRVRALAMSRLIAAVSAAAFVGIAVGPAQENALLTAARKALAKSSSATWVLEQLGHWAVLGTVALTAYLVLSLSMAGVWKNWHQKESLRLCKDPGNRPVRLSLSGWVFAVLYSLCLVLSATYWYLSVLSVVDQVPFYAAAIILPYLGWGLIWPFVGTRMRRLAPRS